MRYAFGLFILVILSCSSTKEYTSFYYNTDVLDTLEANESSIGARLAFIGEYEKARSTYEIDPSIRYYEKESFINGIEYDSLVYVDAKSFILQGAANRQIIMINEAHNNPKHRIFVKSLLSDLYELGYRYFAVEALLNRKDSPNNYSQSDLVNFNTYPSKYVSYISDPHMNGLLTEAVDIGFKLIPYEKNEKGNRERVQAENIQNSIFAHDKAAKVLVLAGYCHILESQGERPYNCGKSKWMASFLKEMTGIDPLTINQEIMDERFLGNEHPLYNSEIEFAAAILNGHRQPISIENLGSSDIYIQHPRTSFSYGRPNWLLAQESKTLYKIDTKRHCKNVGYPCLIEAKRNGLDTTEVPVDIISISEEDKAGFLYLSPGIYTIMSSRNGKGVEKKITIK